MTLGSKDSGGSFGLIFCGPTLIVCPFWLRVGDTLVVVGVWGVKMFHSAGDSEPLGSY